MSTSVGFVLFDFRKYPIELTRGYLASAEFTNPARVYLQRRPAVWTIQVGSSLAGFCLFVSNKCPVFAPLPKVSVRTGNDLAIGVDRVVKALSPHSQRDALVEGVLLNLYRLYCCDCSIVNNIP